MKIALGTAELTDFQARAIRLATEGKGQTLPKFPRAATREQCRNWLLVHGLNGLGAAEQDLRYLKDRLDARDSWRRGQPEVKR